MNRRLTTAALAAALFVAAGCGDGDADEAATTTAAVAKAAEPAASTAAAEPAAAIDVADAWARQSPMATDRGAIYLKLTSSSGDALVAAAVPAEVAGKVEIHETVAVDTAQGTDAGAAGSMPSGSTMGGAGAPAAMTMRPIGELALPPGETVELKPGGYHIMLLDLTGPLVAGQRIDLTLAFASGETLDLSVPVLVEAP
jgi:copper(I)-binding protein